MAKPKTIKPVRMYALYRTGFGFLPRIFKDKDKARCDPAAVTLSEYELQIVCVEIRDAATAKLERAAIYAKCKAAGLSFRDLRGSGDAAAKGGRADG
jgi:hypothetical protein